MILRCKHRWCSAKFESSAPDLLFCPSCRIQLLAAERSVPSGDCTIWEWDNREAIATTAFWAEQLRSPFDYRLLDENGREVWASDLIKRYKRETRPRPARTQKYN